MKNIFLSNTFFFTFILLLCYGMTGCTKYYKVEFSEWSLKNDICPQNTAAANLSGQCG
jgi:hypothetical protein